MASVGRMRDLVKLYYQDGTTTDALGSDKPTYTEVTVWADVVPMSFEATQKFNLNFQDANYSLTCRVVEVGRVAFVEYNGNRYDVINPVPDKHGVFMKMYIRRKV